MSLLEINDLTVEFPTRRQTFVAVDSAQLTVEPGEIHGLVGDDNDDQGNLVFHAGVRNAGDGSGRLLTSGGRVLACVGAGVSVEEARDRAYHRAARISFDGAYYRRDIADLRSGQPATIR